MPVLNVIGPKSGRCNICGAVGPLTEDHIPPKALAQNIALRLNHLVSELGAEKAPPGTKMPDGIKFRSLCQRCNGVVLSRYDKALVAMADQVTAMLRTPILLDGSQTVRVKPQLVARAVLGHLCALGINRYNEGDPQKFGEYVLNDQSTFLQDCRVCYWVYPFAGRTVARDLFITYIGTKIASQVMIMKCYPIAFAIIVNKALPLDGWQPPSFDFYASLGPDDEVELPIYLDQIPDQIWPEMPHRDGNMVALLGEAAYVAKLSSPRGQVLKNRLKR